MAEFVEPREQTTPLGERTVYDWMVERVNMSSRWIRDWKDDALLYFQAYAGDQWTEDVRKELMARDRLPVVYNQVLSVMNSAASSEMMERMVPKFLPRNVDDQQVSDILNGALRYLRDQTDAEVEESQAFLDCLICGVGVVQIYQDYTEGPEGRTKVDRMPVFRLFWDRHVQKPNMKDMEWWAGYEYMTRENAVQKWPEWKEEIENYVTAFPELDADVNWHSKTRIAGLPWFDIDSGRVLILSYEYREMEPYYLSVDPATGQRVEMTPEEWTALRVQLREVNETLPPGERTPMPQGVRMERYVYKRAHFMGSITLDDEPLPTQNGFSAKFMTCFRDQHEDHVEFFGLMKVCYDPQVYVNKALSQILYMLSTNPKGAILAEEKTFKDASAAMVNWSKPNAVIEVREGALVDGAIQVIRGEYPSDFDRLLQVMSEAVIRAVGFDPYQVGAGGNLSRTAAQSLRHVQRQSMAVISQPYDSLRQYRREIGRSYLEFMRAFMLPGTMIRVSQPGQPDSVVPFDLSWVEDIDYDVVIDEAPASPTQQQELWDSLNVTQSLELLMQAGVITPDLVVEMMPGLPENIRNQMRQNLAEQDAMAQAAQALAAGDVEAALNIIASVAQEMGMAPAAPPAAQQGGGEPPVQ